MCYCLSHKCTHLQRIHKPYLNFVWCFKSIKLVEQLQHSPLHLTVTISAARFHSGRSDTVNFIHKNDRRSMFPVETNESKDSTIRQEIKSKSVSTSATCDVTYPRAHITGKQIVEWFHNNQNDFVIFSSWTEASLLFYHA